ncbi:MAG: zinc-ribbon domain-containing protein [Lachnospiraceae bacterium]|nr:zinc-ribbon domain-containing protein [Lachnospiraceae bacterium]
MFNELRYRFSKFMQGRYGVDSLSRFLSIVLLAIIILGMFIRIPLSGTITLVILVILYWRMFSRNIPKRYEENQKFLQIRDKLLGRFSDFGSNMSQMKDYHIYKCPRCNQKIRIPRGKGHIMVRCPKCGYEFHKKS